MNPYTTKKVPDATVDYRRKEWEPVITDSRFAQVIHGNDPVAWSVVLSICHPVRQFTRFSRSMQELGAVGGFFRARGPVTLEGVA